MNIKIIMEPLRAYSNLIILRNFQYWPKFSVFISIFIKNSQCVFISFKLGIPKFIDAKNWRILGSECLPVLVFGHEELLRN